LEADPERPGRVLRSPTRDALDAATRSGGKRLLVAVHCLPLGCGPGKGDGARLAGVWQSDEGLLYVAVVPLGRQGSYRNEDDSSDRWKPQTEGRVRDLLDREDLEHPPLRAVCRVHGDVMLERDALLREVQKSRSTSARRVLISAVASVRL